MKKLPFLPALLAALAILTAWAPGAHAQLSNAQIVASCGNQSWTAGQTRAITQDPTGKQCVNASVTANATIASFAPGASATQTLAVTNSSARSTALSGATQLIQNTGSVDAYLVFGNSSVVATTSGTLLRAGYAISYDVSASSATNVAAITASGSTSLTISGGTGQPSMAGASGGGGSVPTGSAGSPNAAVLTVQGITSMTALKTDGSGVTQPVSIAGTVAVSAASLPLPTGAATSALQTTGNTSLATIATNTASPIPAQAGTVIIGGVGIDPSNNLVSAKAAATGGATPSLQAALSTTVQSIKSSAGTLYKVLCYNPNATVAYVQVFNIASGSVTLGTSTPLESIPVPATSNGGFSGGALGDAFGTAISWAATTTATGSTAPGTALVCNAAYN